MNIHNKHFLIPALACMSAAILLSCSDKNDNKLPDLADKTYTGDTQLKLEYCDQQMSGKFVRVTPTDAGHAILTFGSELDLSAIPGAGLNGKLPAPGVLPGSPMLQIPVTLHADGNEYEFSGKGETDYVTYTYSGDIKENFLEFEFDDVRLKNTSLAGGVWKPAPMVKGDEILSYKSSPFHIVWDVAPIPELHMLEFPISDLMQSLLNVPFIPVYHGTAYSSIAQLYTQALQTVAFLPNGNIPVRFFSSSNGATQLQTTVGNSLQYVVLSNNMLKLYINPLDVFGLYLTNKGNGYTGNETITWKMPSRADATTTQNAVLDNIIAGLLQSLAPEFANGIPQQYEITPSSLDIYANTIMGQTIMKNVILPLFQDPQTLQAFMTAVQNDPKLAPYTAQIQTALKLFPKIVEQTERFELGFSFIPYSNPGK